MQFSLLACTYHTLCTDGKQRKAAQQRAKDPSRPFNPANPYDTPNPTPPAADDNVSVAPSDATSSYIQHMPRAMSVASETTEAPRESSVASEMMPPPPKRHLRVESQEVAEQALRQARQNRIKELRLEVAMLQAEKERQEEEELAKQVAELRQELRE